MTVTLPKKRRKIRILHSLQPFLLKIIVEILNNFLSKQPINPAVAQETVVVVVEPIATEGLHRPPP